MIGHHRLFTYRTNSRKCLFCLFLSFHIFTKFFTSLFLVIRTILFSDEGSLCNDLKGMNILIKQLAIVKELCLSKYVESNQIYIDNINKMVGSGIKDKLEQALSPRLVDIQKNRSV